LSLALLGEVEEVGEAAENAADLAADVAAGGGGLLASLPTAKPMLGRTTGGTQISLAKLAPAPDLPQKAPGLMPAVPSEAKPILGDGAGQEAEPEEVPLEAEDFTALDLPGVSEREKAEILKGMREGVGTVRGSDLHDKDWHIKAAVAKGASGAVEKERVRPGVTTNSWDAAAGVATTSNEPNMVQKRKHQINWLAYDMQQKQDELHDRSQQGMLTKSQTYAKYGW
jgi:hypothetical protein